MRSSSLIPVRLVKEYAYCPRYAYFQVYVERDYVTPSMREALASPPPEVPRFRGWEVLRGVRVVSRSLGLVGVADALLVKGRLVRAVEVKAMTGLSRKSLRGRHRHVLAQALAYGVCAEETLGLTLAGVVVVGSGAVVEVPVTPALRAYLRSLVAGLRRVLDREELPPAAPLDPRGCGYCRFRDLCRATPF